MHHFITIVNADPYIPATVLPCNTEAEIDEAAAYLADEGIDSAQIWSGDPEGESVKTHFVVLAEERDEDEPAPAPVVYSQQDLADAAKGLGYSLE